MEESGFVPPKAAITGGFSGGADFISYIIAGLLIARGAKTLQRDRLLGVASEV